MQFQQTGCKFSARSRKERHSEGENDKKNWSKFWKRSRRDTTCSLEFPAKNLLPKTFCRKLSAKIQKLSLKFLKVSKTYPYWKKVVFSKKVALDTMS